MTRSRNFLRSGAVNVAFQVLFLVVLWWAGREVALAQGAWRDVALVALVLVPSVIWTSFFYLQDRVEPEPTGYVAVSFVAGMAAAAFAALPLLQGLLDLRSWMYGSVPALVLGSVCLFGGITAFLIYAVLRHGLLPTREFDEPADGLVYGAFVGSGFAFVQSFVYLADRPDFTLFVIAYTATTNILVYASVGALVGELVALPKFEEEAGRGSFVAGVGLGAVLLGAYRVANEFIFLSGAEQAFWLSFALSVVFAVALLAFAFLRIRRAAAPGAGRTTFEVARGLDGAVAGLVLVLLGAGVVTERLVRADRTYHDDEAGVAFTYPAAVRESPVGLDPARPVLGRVLFAGELEGAATVRVASWEVPGGVDLAALDPTRYLTSPAPVRIVTRDHDTGGRESLRVRYAFVDSAETLGADLPRMVWGTSDLVPAGDRVLAFSVESSPSGFDRAEDVFSDIVETVTWDREEGP